MKKLLFFLLGLGVFGGVKASEEDGPSIVHFQIKPFNALRWEKWAEGSVRLKNGGTTPWEGMVAAEFPTVKEPFHLVFKRKVTLPPRSEQELDLMVRFPPPYAMSAGGAKGFPVLVRLMKGNSTIFQDTFGIPPLDYGTSVLWVGTSNFDLAYHLKKAPRPAEFRGLKDLTISVAQIEKLCRRTMGYDPYDLVVLSDWGNPPDALQIDALLSWVRRGGKMIVMAGAHWQTAPLARIAETLPLWPTETYEVSAIPEIESWAGDLGIYDGITLMDGPRAKQAEILIGNQDQPLLTRRSLGLGSALFLALDVDRRNGKPAPGMTKFLQKVLHLAIEQPTAPVDFSDASARQLVERLIAVRIVPREKMAMILGGYGALIFVLLIVGRIYRKPEWSYALIGGLSIFWFLLLQKASARERGNSASQIERVRGYLAEMRMGDDAVNLAAVEGFFPPSQRNLDLESAQLSSFEGALLPISARAGERAEVAEIQTRDTLGVGSWQLMPNALRMMLLSDEIRLTNSTIQCSARLTKDGLALDVDSRLPGKLENSFFKWNRFIFPLQNLEGEKSLHVETWKRPGDFGHYVSGGLQEGLNVARDLLRQEAFPDSLRRWPSQVEMQRAIQRIRNKAARKVVVGGYPSEKIAFWKKSDPERKETTMGLLLARGEEEIMEADPEFFMPRGIADLDLEGKGTPVAYLGDGNFASTREDSLSVIFHLPPCLHDFEATNLKIYSDFESVHFNPIVTVGVGSTSAPPRQWVSLPWSGEMNVPEAPLNFSNGVDSVWVRIKIRRRTGAKSASPADEAANLSQSWYLRDLDISLQGRKLAQPLVSSQF